MKAKFSDHIGAVLLVWLIVDVIAVLAWHNYRYGGDYYYMKVGDSIGTFTVEVPVNVPVNAYIYRGVAKNDKGQKQELTLKTDNVDPGPFKKGSTVRLTVNKNYGITNYKVVSKKKTIFNF
ncbi:YxeA family protein [Lactiplantibacillus plantarum]|uniref:YxeA family protein n=1 Tax=Lactiplantibacillus plantarum TaxID=1590 RepID=UPI001AAE212B|nr:YxeA family protein [Lactiplantibacillus plantarum]MBO2705795.1 YxeA family protein [Lactiplantibacillus plantarum]MDN7038271.1 YxeA family protein [Lactiplantibacillus plantarum]MDO7795363.1 YxeA family protein [Lactiplantibacillus plantarum]WVI00467.1 YxeA family protein [Lactiplantibacillus plantarum]